MTVTPYEFVRLELTPEVPVMDEPTTVTCTANVPDVHTIQVYSFNLNSGCDFNTLNNQTRCYDNYNNDIIDINVSIYKHSFMSFGFRT